MVLLLAALSLISFNAARNEPRANFFVYLDYSFNDCHLSL